MRPQANSVHSTQTTIHRDLALLVQKHSGTTFAKPFAEHTVAAFANANSIVEQTGKSIILDSCCGTGESTRFLAHEFPESLVVGVDKSAHRLAKSTKVPVTHSQPHSPADSKTLLQIENQNEKLPSNATNTSANVLPNNVLFVRADVIDFWRLALAAACEGRWQIQQHYVLYPNPYPKPQHIKQRWHGHPVFPTLVQLAPYTEIRTNWRTYAEETALAASILGAQAQAQEFTPPAPMTAFERKFMESGQTLYRVTFSR